MGDTSFTPPSRERFREERRAQRRADRRRQLLAFPIVVAGIALLTAGVMVFMQDDASEVPVDVQGTSTVQTTLPLATTSTTTSTVPIYEDEYETDANGTDVDGTDVEGTTDVDGTALDE